MISMARNALWLAVGDATPKFSGAGRRRAATQSWASLAQKGNHAGIFQATGLPPHARQAGEHCVRRNGRVRVRRLRQTHQQGAVMPAVELDQAMRADFEAWSVHDAVNHPKHYTSHPSGVECIQVTEHMGFNLGNAVKYIWRADLKADAIEDLKKAKWYIERELKRRELPNTGNERAEGSAR